MIDKLDKRRIDNKNYTQNSELRKKIKTPNW